MNDLGTCTIFQVWGRGEVALVEAIPDRLPLIGDVVVVNGEQRIVEAIELPERVFTAARTGIAVVLRPGLAG